MSSDKTGDEVPGVSEAKRRKRPICSRCERPMPRACICEALPDHPISLHKCQMVVLQHPHESRRKNRSMPLVELCLNKNDLQVVVGRRFGETIDPSVMALVQDPDRHVILVYPSADAVSLTQGLQQIQVRRKDEAHDAKITVVLLDGTWKYAREMNDANESTGQYPNHLIRVKIRPEDWKTMVGQHSDVEFQPRRFDIRTPPSPSHLSTAECIAWLVATIEGDPSLFDTIMKPLDLMVEKWHSCSDNRSQKRSFAERDGHTDEASRDNNSDTTTREQKPQRKK